MKLKVILQSAAILIAGALAFACQQKEQDTQARAVATSETYVVFASTEAESQVLDVYADGVWAVDVEEDWISVSPMNGNGHGTITITVADNATGSIIDRPRDGHITVQGGNLERRSLITVHQQGDTYYGVQVLTLAQVAALEDAEVAKVASAKVVALTQKGFVLTDDSGSLYATGEVQGIQVGDILSFNGAKTTLYGGAAFATDEVTVTSHEDMVYPTATDMTSLLNKYEGGVLFLMLKGSVVNGVLKVGPANVQLVDPVESLELDKVDLHKVAVTGYAVGLSGTTGYMVVTAVEDEGADETLIPYPLRWAMGKDLNYSSSTFTKDSPRIDPIQGIGYIEYVPYDLESTNSSGNYNLDVESGNPRVSGPWQNDYWLFYGNGAIPANSEVQISFEMRSSQWGMKYWVLEYMDGDQWLTAPDVKYSDEPGYETPYHVATDVSNTNQPLQMVIKFRKNNDHLQIRLRCSALWRGGGGYTASRSTASSRLTVTNADDDTYKPSVIILKEGNGIEKDPVYADIQVSTDLLTFNGTPGEPKTLTITSDHDFTVSTAASWLTLEPAEGVAGEATEVKVTCEESQLAELRQTTLKIVSEDSEKVVNVVQSAAGQMLDPFVSISGGNKMEVSEDAGKADVKVQANVEVSFETADAWINVAPAETKAMVEWTNFVVSYEANESEAPRTGTIRFFNEEKNVEAVLTVEQAGKEVILDNTLIQWGFDATLMDQYKDAFEKDNAFKANIAGSGVLSWHNLPENVAADTGNKKSQVIGGTGQPYVTGAWPGDYWLFTFPVKDVAKGSVISFSALSKVSGTGHRFWRMDYSIDGNNWYPAAELKTETLTGTEAKYTHEFATTSDTKVEASITAPIAIPEATVQIRFTCVANWQQKGGALAAPNGGTHRWAGGKDDGPKITIAEPEPPVSALPIKWSFGDPSALTAGVDYGITWPNVYLYADDGVSRLDLVRPGERSAPTTLTFSTEGNFTRILSTGVGLGDYWLFTLPVKDQQAGTYSISYKATSSNAGPKFFLLEYSLDQTTWYPIQAQKGTFQVKDKPETAREVTYTYMISGNNVTCEVNASMKAPALSGRQVIYVRARVSDNLCCNLSKELNGLEHGGTTRIGGGIDITFTAD